MGRMSIAAGVAIGPPGGGFPRINLSASSVLESASTGTVIGALSVINHPSGASGWTFAITSQTPTGKLAISTANLQTAAALDYETNSSLSVTITASKSGQPDIVNTKTITVTNVFEAASLSALSLSNTSATQGAAFTSNIVGATAGSTITGTVPAGLTINSGARTITGTPTGSGLGSAVSLTETLADSANSPRTTILSIDIAAAADPSAERILIALEFGDSRIGGTYARDPAIDTVNPNIFQVVTDFNTPGTPDADYGPSHGLTIIGLSNELPLQMYANTMGTASHLSPFEGMGRYLIDQGYYTKVVHLGAGFGSSHMLGTEPTATTAISAYAKPKMALALSLVQARWPGATIDKALCLEFGVNDMTSADTLSYITNGLHDTTVSWAADMRTVSGWETAPVIGVAITPEEAITVGIRNVGDTAMRVAVLDDISNGFWVQYPTGLGGLHEGDYSGTTAERQQMVRDAGYLHIGPVVAEATGRKTKITPTFTIADNFSVTEGSTTEINLACDRPVYFSVAAGSTGLVTLSGDFELYNQSLRPTGGAWPAYDAATPANNNRAYTLNYKTGDGVTGSITRHVQIAQNLVVTHYAYDDFNRADTTASATALGTTPGKDGTGSGLTWTPVPAGSWGKIDTGKAAIPYDSSHTSVAFLVNSGRASGKIMCDITVAGASFSPRVYACADSTLGNGVYYEASGQFKAIGGHNIGNQASLSALSDGVHSITVSVDDLNSRAGLAIDGVDIFPLTGPSSGPAFAATRTYVGFGNNYINDNTRFDNFDHQALRSFAGSATIADVAGSNLVGWWEAADLADGAVSSWASRGGTASALTASGAVRPVRAATSFNSLPGITFDGVDDWLQGLLNASLSAGYKLQVFAAVKILAGGEAGGRVVSTNNGSGNDWDDGKYIPLRNVSGSSFAPYVAYFGSIPSITLAAGDHHIVGSLMLSGGIILPVDTTIPTRTDIAWNGYVPSYAPTQLFVGGDHAGGQNASMVIGSLVVVKDLITRPEIEAIMARMKTQNGL